MSSNSFDQVSGGGATPGLRYSSKLMSALHQFGTLSGLKNLSTAVENPLSAQYGKAYDYLVSADALRHRDEYDPAIVKYQQALSLRPDLLEAYLGLGKCYRRKGDSLGAIRTFKQALGINQFNAESMIELAKCYNDIGQLDLAIKHYQRALKITPRCMEARFGLALVHELNHNDQQAIGLYQELIHQDPEFFPAYNNLASIYLRLQVYEAAEETFRVLVKLAPEFARGHFGLAVTLDKMGKHREALHRYQQVLQMNPGQRNVDYIASRIHALRSGLRHKHPAANTITPAATSTATLLVRVK